MSAWIKWEGGECPVDPETVVRVRFRDGSVSSNSRTAGWWDAGTSNWKHDPITHSADIIAYRVVAS